MPPHNPLCRLELYQTNSVASRYDGTVAPDWIPSTQPEVDNITAGFSQTWTAAVVVTPQATAPVGMQVMGPDGKAIALGTVTPSMSPPLRVTGTFPAISIVEVRSHTCLRSPVCYGVAPEADETT
jgi:hypothetical protein